MTRRYILNKLFPLVLLALSAVSVFAVEPSVVVATGAEQANRPGFVRYRTALQEEPKFSSKKIQRLKIGTRVQILQSKSGWMLIGLEKSPDIQGWVRFSKVRPTRSSSVANTAVPAREPSSSGGLSSLARGMTGLFGGSSSRPKKAGTTTSTIGIRGLNPDDLKTAKADLRQLEKLHGYQVSAATAEKYAGELQLESRTLARLDTDTRKQEADDD